MTRDEVVATVAAPPGVYTNRPYRPAVHGLPGSEHWVAYDGELVVWFNDDGTAGKVEVYDPLPDHRSLVRRLRSRFGL